MQDDPREIIDREPMSGLQAFAVGICIFLNALDGFDVLAITFAAPGIAQDWGLEKGVVGIMISSGLVGMAIGSLFLSSYADRFGRRKVILASLVTMGVGMLLSAFATDVITMSIYRVFTGLGIGAMLATTNAMVAEYSNKKRRDLSVSLMAIGYPIGGVLGGSVAAWLLFHYDWQSVFIFGGLVTLATIPVILMFMPESIEFLSSSKGQAALDKINAILRRMGHSEAHHVIEPEKPEARPGMKELFVPDQRKKTLVLGISYFFHITTFYFILGWVPSIVTSMGFDKATGAEVSVWVNVGGIVGGTILGWLAAYFSLFRLVIIVMVATGVAAIAFGQVGADLTLLKIVAVIVGIFMFSGVVGLYALAARKFPTRLRATGTGFVIGLGRGGSVVAPVMTGYLLEAGMGHGNVSIILAFGSICAALVLIFSRLEQEKAA